MNYISILEKKGGAEISRLESNSQDSNTLSVISENLSLLPNAPITSNIYIGTGPPGFYLLFKNNNNTLSNVTLSGSFTFNNNGFLDLVSGGVPGLIALENISGTPGANNVAVIKVVDENRWRQIGLFVTTPTPGAIPNTAELNLKERLQIENIKLDSSKTPGGFASSNTSIYFYGDGAGGGPPYPPKGWTLTPNVYYYAGTEWYSLYSNSTSLNQVLYRRQNLHFNRANSFLPLNWEFRTYHNTQYVSFISEIAYGSELSDVPMFQWEWKCHHSNLHCDLNPEETSNVNEVNKITHGVSFASGITSISFATDWSSNVGNTENNTLFKFHPENPNDPTSVPKGTFTFQTSGSIGWQANAESMMVKYNKQALATDDAALEVSGGLGVKKFTHLGDTLWLTSNSINNSYILFRPPDLGLGSSEIQINAASSNTLIFASPEIIPAFPSGSARQLRDRIKINYKVVQIGDKDPACESVKLSITDHANALTLINGQVVVNNELNATDLVVKNNSLGGSPLLKVAGNTIVAGDNLVEINTLDTTSGVYSAVKLSNSSSGSSSQIDINSDGKDLRLNVHGNNTDVSTSNSLFNVRGQIVTIGENAYTEDPEFIVFGKNPFDLTDPFRNIDSDDNYVRLADNRFILDSRKGSDFSSSTIQTPERLSIQGATSTLEIFKIRADSNVSGNNFVEVNPLKSATMGFNVKTSGVDYALTVGSQKAHRQVKLGVPLVGSENTKAGHLASPSKTAHGLVFNETSNHYCYYSEDTSNLLCLRTDQDTQLRIYDDYSNTSTIDVNEIGNLQMANVFMTNRQPVVGKPQNEYSNITPRVVVPTITLGDTHLRAMLPVNCFHAYRTTGNNLGPDNIDYEEAGTGMFQTLNYKGQNPGIIANLKRLVWGRTFSYFDGRFVPYSTAEIPPSTINLGDVTFKKAYAPYDGWITNVQFQLASNVHFVQGDTTWDGTVTAFRGFAAFYLGSNLTAANDFSYYKNPDDVVRYLKSYQFPSTSQASIDIPAYINVDLPSEEWVWVPQGTPLPWPKMTCYAGSENSLWRLRTEGLEDFPNIESGMMYAATVSFMMAPPKIGTQRADPRWEI